MTWRNQQFRQFRRFGNSDNSGNFRFSGKAGFYRIIHFSINLPDTWCG